MPDGMDSFSAEVAAPSTDAGDSERALIAAVLADETRAHRAAEQAAGIVTAASFSRAANGRVWDALLAVVRRGDVPDVPMVAEHLGDDKPAQEALVAAAERAVAPSAFGQHARRVAQHAHRRAVRAGVRDALRALDATDPEAAVRGAFETLATLPRVSGVDTDDSAHAAVVSTLTRILKRYEAALAGARPTALWGVPALDGGTIPGRGFCEGAVGGLFPGKLYVLAGVPGAGKTSLAWCAALATARGGGRTPGRKVLVFSLEMSREDICQRIAAQACGVSEALIENGRLTSGQVDALCNFLRDDLSKLPIHVITSCRTIEEMRARVLAEMAAATDGEASKVGLVVIDFLQRTKVARRSDDANRDDQDRVYEAKGIANEGVPVLAVSSMSKTGQANADEGKVKMRDASGSGSEYAADFMAFLVRTKPDDRSPVVEVRFEVVKHRGGASTSTTLMFDMRRGTFAGARNSDADYDAPWRDDEP